MIETQEQLLTRYRELSNNPTLREIAEETGLQLTRVFRLFNGSEMKLYEYKIFKERIASLEGMQSELLSLVGQLEGNLPATRLTRVKKMLNRELAYSELAKDNNSQQPA